MTTDRTASGWDFESLAQVWDVRTNAIIAGADRIDLLDDAERADSLSELSERVGALSRALDDGWLAAAALFMVEDLYKSCSHGFRWSSGVGQYISATAQTFVGELTRRAYVLHYVIDNVQPDSTLDETLATATAVFASAGLMVCGPQLMAFELMERTDHQPRDVAALPRYRDEGHFVANQLVERCHLERRHSVYLNLDLDDDTPALSLDVALSQAGAPGTIVVFRNQPPSIGTVAQIAPPPGIPLPTLGPS